MLSLSDPNAVRAGVAGLSRLAAVEVVDSLVAKSLLVHEESAGRSRFRLFETTAAYAGQRLGDARVKATRSAIGIWIITSRLPHAILSPCSPISQSRFESALALTATAPGQQLEAVSRSRLGATYPAWRTCW